MRVAIVGSGGTGGYFGGLLARAGEEVTFIARGAHLEALRLQGLRVKSRLAGEFTLPVRATDTPNEVGPVDLILLCVKTYDTEAAAQSIRPLSGADTLLLSLRHLRRSEALHQRCARPAVIPQRFANNTAAPVAF